MYTRAEIERYIPHREPFIFIDEVVAFAPHRSARAVLRLSGDEPFFRGHFPDAPIMPGVLILEHMVQAAGFLVGRSRGSEGRLLLFGGVERARFLHPVTPGSELVTDVTAVKLFETMGLVDAVSRVDERDVAHARVQFGEMR